MDDPSSPPNEIDPYATLNVPTTATAAEIRTAYRKLALSHHPDKVPAPEKENAHKTFQNIAFAYAILSDDRRRKRYDATGNTSESLDIEDEGFDWADFFRAQWESAVNEDTIATFKTSYQGSAEERRDLLAAYTKCKGDMNKAFEEIILSNPLDDEERYRKWIDEAIEKGDVEGYTKYTNETDTSKRKRRQKAEREAREAEEHLRDTQDKKRKRHTKVEDEIDTAKGDLGGLAAMIQQRQKGRAANFLDDLEAKYGVTNGSGKGKGKKRREEEPPEEAFREMKSRGRKK